jgi:MFS family permease
MTAGAAVLSSFTYVPILAREVLGADEFYVTILVASYATASFLSSYLFGRAGDIYGRRIVLRVGILLATLSFGLLAFADNLEMLYIVRILNGFSVGIYPGALAAYAYESKMKMGRFASFGALGWGLGTIFAGYAAGFNVSYAFMAASVFFIIAFLSALSLPPITRIPLRVPLFPVETLKRNFSIYAAVLIRHSSASAVWTLWPLFLYDLGGDYFTIGIIQAANSLSQVIFMVGLTDRYDYSRLVPVGLIASLVTFAWIATAQSIIDIIPSQIILGFAWACLYVGALKYVTEKNEERSTASGLLQSILAVSGVLGPIYASILWLLWGAYLPIILFAAIMSGVAYFVFVLIERRNQKAVQPSEGVSVPD